VVTVLPAARTVSLDLQGAGGLAGAGHLEVRIDGGPPALVPAADPFTIRLPEGLAPGAHRVDLAFRRGAGAGLLVAGSAIRPGRSAGGARVEGGDLVQAGPSIVDVAARPGSGRTLAGELCPAGFLGGTGGAAVQLFDAEDRPIAEGGGAEGARTRLGDRSLTRPWGCRRIELATGEEAGPLRVRFTLPAEGREVRWRGWRWLPAPAAHVPPAELPAAGARPAEAERALAGHGPPRLVVVYVLDALRADHLGHLGGPPGISPVIDRLAGEGATFRRHWSTAPNTLPAIRNLFTGEVWASNAAWRETGSARPTLAEVFRDAGWRTGLFSANGYLSTHFGLSRGFGHVSREALFDGLSSDGVNRSAEEVHAAALDWLDGLAGPTGEEPAFLYLQTVHPHNPYAPPPDLERRFTAGVPSEIAGDTATLKAIQRGSFVPTGADRERLRGLYAASVAYNDRELGRFLTALAHRVPPEETLLVVTSDHGEELFDHGGVLHGYTLYEELLHVPLVVRWPGTVKPAERTEPTDALDLHATLVDLAGASGRTPASGRSLLPLLTGRQEDLPARLLFAAAPGVAGGIHAVRDGDWKLFRTAGTERSWAIGRGRAHSWRREYLFDLASDPGERRNLAGLGGPREAWLRARLAAWLAERRAAGGEAGEPAAEEPLDQETERRLRALGYLD
jgi:arylsulfatase A-like enzyme